MLAPITRRLVAWTVDATLVYVGLLLPPAAYMESQRTEPTLFEPARHPTVVANLLMAVGLALAAAYPVFFEGADAGQTPGMRLLGIRLVRERDLRPLGFRRAAVRLIGLVANFFGIGLLVACWDARRRTLRDQVAGTLMVRASAFPAPAWPGEGSWSG